MFVSRSCVLLGFFVLAERVMMLGLMMMVGGCVVVSGRELMMLTSRMLRCLCHALPPLFETETDTPQLNLGFTRQSSHLGFPRQSRDRGADDTWPLARL